MSKGTPVIAVRLPAEVAEWVEREVQRSMDRPVPVTRTDVIVKAIRDAMRHRLRSNKKRAVRLFPAPSAAAKPSAEGPPGQVSPQ